MLGAVLSACSDSTDPDDRFESLTIVADSTRIIVGDSLQLRAYASLDRTLPLPPELITWTVSEPEIARIDSTGMLHSLAPGVVTVSAAGGARDSQLQITLVADPIISVEAGQASQACALLQSGRLYCWGAGGGPQFGDSLTDHSPRPLRFPTTFAFKSVSVGVRHSCGLDAQGTAFCWGENYFGEIGDGTTRNERHRPTPVNTAVRFADITAGDPLTCAVALDGKLYCWGFYGDAAESATPVLLGEGFSAVSGGLRHACALKLDGTAHCWGAGALGNSDAGCGEIMCSDTPVAVDGGMRFKTVDARGYTGGAVGGVGDTHNCAVRTDDKGICWEWPPSADSVIAQPLFTELGAGAFNCGLTPQGAAYCWGSNSYGQLGIGTVSGYEQRPVPVAGGHTFRGLTVGGRDACGWTEDDLIYCWGAGAVAPSGGDVTVPRRVRLFE